MLFAIGTRVRLRFTGESGVVTARLEDSMLQVRLDNDPDFEIPAFEEDLIRYDDLASSKPGAEFLPPGKSVDKPAPPARRVLKSQYHILKPRGLQLAFEPMPGRDELVSKYKVWLINDTQHEFLMEFDLYSTTRDILRIDEKIPAAVALELGDFLSDDLNDAPEAFLRVQRITTAGPDTPLEHTLRIRAKQFFNSLLTAPILNVLAHQFIMIDSFEQPAQSAGEDLLEYARQNTKKPKNTPAGRSKAFDPEAFATFIPEIDLHIQNLINGHARLDKGEIVRIQLQHFHRFLDNAVRLGMPRVFVIHGVGEGKLRESIAAELAQHPHVVKFKNEYHHKYGYGATEVVLQQ
jgi:Smr domain